MRLVVGEIFVDLVGDHPQIVSARERGELVEMAAAEHLAVGIVGSGEVDRGGARRERRLEQRRGVERRIGVEPLAELDLDRHRAGVGEDAGDERPVRRGDDHLVAGIEQRAGGGGERVGRADGDLQVERQDPIEAVLGSQLVRERVEQPRFAGRRAVAEMRGVERERQAGRRRAMGVAEMKRHAVFAVTSEPTGQARKDALAQRPRRARQNGRARHQGAFGGVRATMVNSMRRFLARPASVRLSAIGLSGP